MREISTELHIIFITGDGEKFINRDDAEKHQEKLLRNDYNFIKKKYEDTLNRWAKFKKN